MHCLQLFVVRSAILHERWLGSVAGRRQMYQLLTNSLYGSNTYPVLFWAAKLRCEFDRNKSNIQFVDTGSILTS